MVQVLDVDEIEEDQAQHQSTHHHFLSLLLVLTYIVTLASLQVVGFVGFTIQDHAAFLVYQESHAQLQLVEVVPFEV